MSPGIGPPKKKKKKKLFWRGGEARFPRPRSPCCRRRKGRGGEKKRSGAMIVAYAASPADITSLEKAAAATHRAELGRGGGGEKKKKWRSPSWSKAYRARGQRALAWAVAFFCCERPEGKKGRGGEKKGRDYPFPFHLRFASVLLPCLSCIGRGRRLVEEAR